MQRLLTFALPLLVEGGCLGTGCSGKVTAMGETAITLTGELAGRQFAHFEDKAPGGREVSASVDPVALIDGLIEVVADGVGKIIALLEPVPTDGG
jgi:hypothetical protein